MLLRRIAQHGARRYKSGVVQDVEALVKDNPQAEKDLQSFVKFYKSVGEGNAFETYTRSQFEKFDSNSDGIISKEEYLREKEKQWEEMDLNASNNVNKEEFVNFQKENFVLWWKVSADQEKLQGEALPASSEDGPVTPPTKKQLMYRVLKIGIPMIVFGFSDNFFMLLGGEAVDVYVGKVIGLSTLAAAGIGNMLSDVVGLSLSKSVETSCGRLGIPSPKFTRAQAKLPIVRLVSSVSAIGGVCIGCTLGLVPLLFFPAGGHDE